MTFDPLTHEELTEDETTAEVEADNARWDELLASDKSQHLLALMAEKAQAEYRAGKAKPMAFDERGRIVPR